MKIQIMPNGNLEVVRKTNKIYKDSTLYYHIAKHLNNMGYSVIRKEMVKDGHMVSENVYYIRDKKWRYCWYDLDANIRSITKAYNKGKVLVLVKRIWE